MTCVVCQFNPATIKYMDCGHTCICGNCIVRHARYKKTCEICGKVPQYLEGHDATANYSIIGLINRNCYHGIEKEEFSIAGFIFAILALPVMFVLLIFMLDAAVIVSTGGSSLEFMTNYTIFDIHLASQRMAPFPSIGITYHVCGYNLGAQHTPEGIDVYFKKKQ